MYRVIDTISYQSSWIHRYPELAKRGEGVMAILEPNQIGERPEVKGRTVRVHRPDGDISELVATKAEEHHSVVGIFFSGISAEEIPRGSEIEW
jgi:hypothetical protein